jgi:hypothetical protein
MKPNKPENKHKNNKSEKVKVYIRIRPFNDYEINIGGQTPFKSIDTKNNILSIKTEFLAKTYAYDGIYDPKSTQERIFDVSAKPIIDVRIKIKNNFYYLI